MFSQSLDGSGIKRFTILACLLAAQFSHGARVKKIVWMESNADKIDLRLGRAVSNLVECSVTTNRGEKIIFNSENSYDQISSNVSYVDRSFYPIIRIERPIQDVNGLWSVNQTYKVDMELKENIQDFDINIRDNLEFIRNKIGKYLQIFEGNYVTFKIPGIFPNMTSCIFQVDSKEKYDVSPAGKFSDMRVKEPDVCGVHIMVDGTFPRNWELYVDDGHDNTYHTDLRVESKKNHYANLEQETLYLQLGKKGSIEFRLGHNDITFCQLEDPMGKKFPAQIDSCSHKIPHVTKLHQGLWKVHYGLKQTSTPFEAHILVQTYGCPSVKSTVTYEENKHMVLSCRFQSAGDNECLFERPDGMLIGMSPEAETERDEYFVQSYNRDWDHSSYGNYVCNLTIRSPTAKDFGTWRCLMNRYERTFETDLRTDRLSESFEERTVKTRNGKILVKQQECPAESAVDSCCNLKSGKTGYNLTRKTNFASDFTFMDNVVGTEVVVENSIMPADSSRVNSTVTNVKSEHINLLCEFRTYEEVVTCMFTRPDNLTIAVVPGVGDGRYEYYGEGYRKELDKDGKGIFECGLTIRTPAEEDFGDWKCSMYNIDEQKTIGTVLKTQYLSKMFIDQSVIPLGNSNPERVSGFNLGAEEGTFEIPNRNPEGPDFQKLPSSSIDKKYILELCGLRTPESNVKINYGQQKCAAGVAA